MRRHLWFCIFFVAADCAPQTKGGATVTIHNKQSAPVDQAGGTVSIDDGSAVAVPPGTVAAGTQVTVQKVATPAEFTVAGTSTASSPVAVVAQNPDGSAATTTTQPMTVSLAVSSGASLALQNEFGLLDVATSADNLCVILKATANNTLFVWRRAAINYDAASKVAKISTLNFGVFQLIYCGAMAMPGFADASQAGVSGEAKYTITMTAPAGFDADLAAGKGCLMIVREEKSTVANCGAAGNPSCDNHHYVIGAGEVALQSGTANTAKAQVPSSAIVSGRSYFAVYYLAEGTAACALKVGDDMDADKSSSSPAVKANAKSFYAFKLDPAALPAGISGTIGTSGPFRVTTSNLLLGGPDAFANFAMFDVAKVCADWDVSGGGSTRTLSFAGGQVGGKSAMPLVVPYTTAQANLRLRIGAVCPTDGTGLAGADPKTGMPYLVTIPKANVDKIYLTPVTMHISTSNPLIAGLNGCIEIAAPGGFNAGGQTLGRMMINFSQPTYNIYLPFLTDPAQQKDGVPLYDMRITALSDGATCDAVKSPLPVVPLSNRPLTADITVQF